jgi:predicted P-loop ATPase
MKKMLIVFNTQFKKMFVRTVASALGIKLNKHAFILVHDQQNSGKSTFLRWLCPRALSNHYIEDIGFDKDSLIALAENFIINLDELSTLSKKDINHLKSIMSKDEIKTRLPYNKRASVMKRRCSFVGSTNNEEFLSDETGNVRWICFTIKSINWNYKNEIDINKVWSQAYALLNEGFEYQLNREEIIENEKANISFLIRTPEIELLQKYFAPSTKGSPGAIFKTTTEITQEIRTKAYNVSITAFQMGKALKILGFQKESKYNSRLKFSIKGSYVIPKEQELFGNEEDEDVLLPDKIPIK